MNRRKANFRAICINPYARGTALAWAWERGFMEAHIAELFDLPLSLILPTFSLPDERT